MASRFIERVYKGLLASSPWGYLCDKGLAAIYQCLEDLGHECFLADLGLIACCSHYSLSLDNVVRGLGLCHVYT